MKRRDFLRVTAATAAASMGALWRRQAAAAGGAADAGRAARMNRIGCTTVSFRPRFPATRADKTPQDGDLTPLEVPKLFADRLGIHRVELWSRHFADSSLDYCRRVREAAAAVGSEIINIQLDDPAYDLSHPEDPKRRQGIEFVKRWMDRAAACGARSLRANTGGGSAPLDVARTGDSFRQLAEHGERIGVKILIENHGGYSSNPDNILALLEHVDSPFCRTLPDFGNMPTRFSWDERAAFLKKLLPHAHLISAKGMVFDEQYRHETYDVGACVRLAESSGFKGVYSIELWAPGYYPPDPIRAVEAMVQAITENLIT